MKNYLTIQGDTWDYIAYKLYGNEFATKQLLEENPSHIDTAIFGSGISLAAPELSKEDLMSGDDAPWRDAR